MSYQEGPKLSALEELGVNLLEQEVCVRLWEVFFLSVLLRAFSENSLAKMLGERLQWAQPSYVCLQIDKNCSGDLMAFTKG